MYNLFISREWLLSAHAQKVYLACACLVPPFLALLAYALWAEGSRSPLFFEDSAALRGLAVFLIYGGIFAVVTLEVAMSYFWFNFDRAGAVGKTLGLLLLLVPPLGTLAYYFAFYRRGVNAIALAASVGKLS